MLNRLLPAAVALLAATAPAFAHLDPGEHGSFMAGATHPLVGLDHVLAMVAVGLWAAATGGRARWAVPLAFMLAMAAGFAAAIAGVELPFVEPAILASVIVIGIMVALALPVPPAGVAAAVAVFALFHGHAHGGELGEAGAAEFAIGFVLATALLHALGLGIGGLMRGPAGRIAIRLLGGLTALAGAWLAFAG
jgi:urease accessory protein